MSSSILVGSALLLAIICSSTRPAVGTSDSAPAFFVFGDSTVDPGNNNYIGTTPDFRADFEPYGRNGFFDKPTGRFSDGRIMVDFIAEYAGLPIIPAYKQPGVDFSHGANFASGGAGVLPETNRGKVIDLPTQLKGFVEVEKSLIEKLGAEKVKVMLREAVYFISIGSNDYLGGYLGSPEMRERYRPEAFVGMVVGNLTNAIQDLYEKGARKFGFLSIGPLGCLPALRAQKAASSGNSDGGCLEEASSLAQAHNNALKSILFSLSAIYRDIKYCNSNFYDWITNKLNKPDEHGFKDGANACCGAGPFGGMYTCGGQRKRKEYTFHLPSRKSSTPSPCSATFTEEGRAVSATATTDMGEENSGNVRKDLANLFGQSLRITAPNEADVEPLVAACTREGGDYQCNNAMGLWKKVKGASEFKAPRAVGEALVNNLPRSDMVGSLTVAGPGFVNVGLSDSWIAKTIHKMLIHGIKKWAPKISVAKVVVDFSSPNIAKEMHVGHLRSTIIGDTLARMFEFSNVEVLRRNHVGDWGTQFGMLIEFLFERLPDWEDARETAIADLQKFYKDSKKRFDEDPAFKERAQKSVVRLQGGEEKYRKAWAQICDISRKEFDAIYQRLGIRLEEKGESFYNPYIPGVLEKLSDMGLVEESQGAQVIRVEGFEVPLIVVKSDGGFNYASTDLTALWYRLNEERAEWIIYVTDIGQSQHFEMFFKAARRAGWLPFNSNTYPRVSHVGFGLVLGEDGKRFRTRNTEVVRLVDLLDEAKSRSKATLITRGKDKEWSEEELDQIAEAIGYGAVKYADLKNNRLTNYTFNFDHMLNYVGNTAVYLLYTHARICSIIRRSGVDIEELKKTGEIKLDHKLERALGVHLLRFAETVEEACANLLPNVLCDYLYNLAQNFGKFYDCENCQVVGSENQTSRLLLCEATAVVMRRCFHLLGIIPVYKM